MLHFLGHVMLWHAVGRAMHGGLTCLQVAVLAVSIIVVMVSLGCRRLW